MASGGGWTAADVTPCALHDVISCELCQRLNPALPSDGERSQRMYAEGDLLSGRLVRLNIDNDGLVTDSFQSRPNVTESEYGGQSQRYNGSDEFNIPSSHSSSGKLWLSPHLVLIAV